MQNYHNGKVVPTLLTVIDKGTHTRLRKPVNGIFAMSTVAQFESLVDHQILELIKILRERYAAEQRDCDIDNWLQFCQSPAHNGLSDLMADSRSRP